MKLKSLQSRIIVFFVLLMMAMQAGGVFLINTLGVANARKTVADELVTGERVFRRLLRQDALRVTQGVRILTSDFAFREALATSDQDTMSSALQNHGARINAQVMMLVSLDRRVQADVMTPNNRGQLFPLPKMLAEAEEQGKSSAIVLLDGHLYQLVAVPVLAPLPIGWVVMGFALDDAVVHDLKNLTGLDVSFVTERGNAPWSLQATTLPPAAQKQLLFALAAGQLVNPGVTSIDVNADEYLSLVSVPPTYGEESVVAVLQQPMSAALGAFQQLKTRLLEFSALGVLISVIGGILIAGGIARPVKQLARAARRISGGDYTDLPLIDRSDELGDLSQAFADMRDGIAARESKIMELAYSDSLTQLANRALFNDRLTQAIGVARRSERAVSVLVMDLDHFKLVNDTLGHHVGDLLLCEVASRLRLALRRTTDTLARMGGDEFAILLATDGMRDAEKVAETIMDCLKTPMTLDGHIVDTQASIGIATYPEHGEDAENIMRRADMAMYLAKRNNTGYGIYQASQDRQSADRLSLMSELRKAVETSQLVMHYQPKIVVSDSSCCYAEALVRWDHPSRGLIPPEDFILFAEQTGYIKTITFWVLNEVIKQCVRLRKDDFVINMAINISARDVTNPELPGYLQQLFKRYACEPKWITLEITESAFFDDPARALMCLNRLSDLGCQLSIDDYGTGYSSLSYLKRLPVGELKIDKSFVLKMATDESDAMIVRSTIDLAHNMGLKVVAEGVEDQGCLDRLVEMGCDLAQGYFFARPMDAQNLHAWLCSAPSRAAEFRAAVDAKAARRLVQSR